MSVANGKKKKDLPRNMISSMSVLVVVFFCMELAYALMLISLYSLIPYKAEALEQALQGLLECFHNIPHGLHNGFIIGFPSIN